MTDLSQFVCTPDMISSYEVDGAVVLPQALTSQNLNDIRLVVDAELEKADKKQFAFSNGQQSRFRGSQDMWRTDETCKSICVDSILPSIAATLMPSSKVNMFFDHLFVKEAQSSHATAWHNDVPYWPVKGRKILSYWIALDDVTEESGALIFCLGSHKWNKAIQPDSFAHHDSGVAPEETLRKMLNGEEYEIKLKTFPMKAGDVLAFDAMAVHCAGPNSSSGTIRRGYAVRYTGDDVVYDPRPGVHKMMLESSILPGGPIDCQRYPIVFGN